MVATINIALPKEKKTKQKKDNSTVNSPASEN